MTTEIGILQFFVIILYQSGRIFLPSLSKQISDRMFMGLLSEATANGQIEVVGRGPATRYRLTSQADVTFVYH